MNGKFLALIVTVALAPMGAACRSNEPLRAERIQVGKSLNPDNSVATHTTRFKPNDTVYASVLTSGAGSAHVSARWTYAGTVVAEPEKQVKYRGDAATEFHIQNSGGLPPGDYRVEIFVDGKSAGAREFKVEKIER